MKSSLRFESISLIVLKLMQECVKQTRSRTSEFYIRSEIYISTETNIAENVRHAFCWRNLSTERLCVNTYAKYISGTVYSLNDKQQFQREKKLACLRLLSLQQNTTRSTWNFDNKKLLDHIKFEANRSFQANSLWRDQQMQGKTTSKETSQVVIHVY